MSAAAGGAVSAVATKGARAQDLYACRVDDVPLGEGRAITLGGRRLALFRTPDAWYALDAVCPHRGGPLADGIVCDRVVICPLHERRFDLASGAGVSGGDDDVAAHAVRVHGDRVYVTLAAAGARAAA